jgi:hypothetical protein
MKFIVQIQSVSDIITNSSSEVFILDSNAANEINEQFNSSSISCHKLTFNYIMNNAYEYFLLGEFLFKTNICTKEEWETLKNIHDWNEAEKYCHNLIHKKYRKKIKELMQNNEYMIVNISDENWGDFDYEGAVDFASEHGLSCWSNR